MLDEWGDILGLIGWSMNFGICILRFFYEDQKNIFIVAMLVLQTAPVIGFAIIIAERLAILA